MTGERYDGTTQETEQTPQDTETPECTPHDTETPERTQAEASDGVDLTTLFTMAREQVSQERRRTASERDAFHAFTQTVADIPPQSQTTHTGAPVMQATTTHRNADASTEIETAYRETVMNVSHYSDEYDESYEEHVSKEFSSNIAAVLTGDASFETRHKRAVIGATTTAAERRDDLVVELDAELASLDRTTETIRSIEAEVSDVERTAVSELRFGSLEGYYTRMETLEDKCTKLLDERQSTLVRQRRRISLPMDAPDIAIYAYQQLPVNYPVVSTIADLLDRIEAVKSDINRAIYD